MNNIYILVFFFKLLNQNIFLKQNYLCVIFVGILISLLQSTKRLTIKMCASCVLFWPNPKNVVKEMWKITRFISWLFLNLKIPTHSTFKELLLSIRPGISRNGQTWPENNNTLWRVLTLYSSRILSLKKSPIFSRYDKCFPKPKTHTG